MPVKPTDLGLLEELDGGVLAEKFSHALSIVADAVTHHDKAGEVNLSIKFKPMGSSQVVLEHKLTQKKPTLRGESVEHDTTKTPVHVGQGGKMTYFPDTQEPLFGRDQSETPRRTSDAED